MSGGDRVVLRLSHKFLANLKIWQKLQGKDEFIIEIERGGLMAQKLFIGEKKNPSIPSLYLSAAVVQRCQVTPVIHAA